MRRERGSSWGQLVCFGALSCVYVVMLWLQPER